MIGKRFLISMVLAALTVTSFLGVSPAMATAPADVQVDLSDYFNTDVVNYAGTYAAKTALMEGNDSYDASQLTAAFPGGAATYEGVNYKFGSFEGSDNQCINIGVETIISIPQGCYSSIRVAAAMAGTVSGYTMKLNYTDGTSSDFTYNLTTWSNLPAAGEKAIFSSNTRLRASTVDASYVYATVPVPSVIRMYYLSVPYGKVVTGITFPLRNGFRVFAITAVQTTANDSKDVAETLIDTLPDAASVQLSDAVAISNARRFADDAIAKGASISNISKLQAVEARLARLISPCIPIDLSSLFNKDGFISLGDTLPDNADTITDWGYVGNWAFNGTKLGNLLTNGSITHNNITYKFGSLVNSDKNMIQFNNDITISTSGILASSISTILTSPDDSKSVNVTIYYVDGTSEQKTLTINGWSVNQNTPNLIATAIRTVLRNNNPTLYPVPIIKEEGLYWSLYSTEITVNPDKAVSSLVFKGDTKVHLLSATEVGFNKDDLVQKLISLINALPALDNITADDVKTISSLRKNIDYAIATGISADEITNLSTFQADEIKANRLVRTISPVDLSANYNADVFLSAGEIDSDTNNTYFDSGWAYNEDLVSARLTNGLLVYDNCNYKFGPFKSKQPNAIIPTTDTVVNLNDGIYSSIRFIAAATNTTTTNYNVLINYTDGTSQNVVLPLIETWGTDGYTPTADAKIAYKIKRVRSRDGYVVLDAFAYYYYLQPVADKKVTSITFKSKNSVRILAVSTIDFSTDELATAANSAMEGLPTVDAAELSDKAAIISADTLVNEAISKGASASEFPKYNQLQDLKAKLTRMENGDAWSETPVISMIDADSKPTSQPVANGKASVSVKAYNYASQRKNVMFIVALYAADGKLLKASVVPKTLEGGFSTVLTSELQMPESVTTNAYVKAYIWNDMTSLKPFSTVAKLPQ